MKTLEQIADEYVQRTYPNNEYITDWSSFMNYYASRHPEWFSNLHKQFAKTYATEAVKEALEKAHDIAKSLLEDETVDVLNYEERLKSILNTKIELL